MQNPVSLQTLAIMASRVVALLFTFMLFMVITLPPVSACHSHCTLPPYPPYEHPAPPSSPKQHHRPPPSHGKGGGGGGGILPPPPVIIPPIINPPPVISPPIINPPPSPPSSCPSCSSPPVKTCPIDALKLGLCLDVLGGLVHVGIGNPVEHICCPVLKGLLELEAAICLCTTIRIKLLNLNIFLPLALQVLATCGLTPPPGFVCPPLL